MFKKIEATFNQLKRESKAWDYSFKIPNEELKEGLLASTRAMNLPEDISLTPYGKNMVRKFDGLEYLNVDHETTKAEQWLYNQQVKIMKQFNLIEGHEYNTSLALEDLRHYAVDCWRNLKQGKEIRHVKPNMNQDRIEAFKTFTEPMEAINDLSKNDHFRSAVELVFNSYPAVTSSREWRVVNLPFQTKHSNVGYPYFKKDISLVPGTSITYGQLCDKEARQLHPRDVVNYPYIAFGRNLRGKARPIFGGSRIQALVFNQLEHSEIQTCKEKFPMFIGYNNPETLKDYLISVSNMCNKHKWLCWNRDFAKFDSTVHYDLRLWASAIRDWRILDHRGREINKFRSISQYKAQIVVGLVNQVWTIQQRIKSGEIDTNLGGGLVNGICSLATHHSVDPECSKIWKECVSNQLFPIIVMGDDNLLIQSKKMKNDEYSAYMKSQFQLDVSTEKGEFGLFFLQRRLIKRNNEWNLITPFTRIVRSLFSKENRKGLGPAGWTLATYMLLEQLLEWPELMIAVARIFYPFDTYKLGTHKDWSQIIEDVRVEDNESYEMLKTDNQRSRFVSTIDKLNDGDPLKQQFIQSLENPSLESKTMKVHRLLKQAFSKG